MPERMQIVVKRAHIQRIGDPAVGTSQELVIDLEHLSNEQIAAVERMINVPADTLHVVLEPVQ